MPEWLSAVLVALVCGALIGLIAIIYHSLDRRIQKLEERPVNGYPVLAKDVEDIKHELGDRERGIRGLLHKHSGYHVENDGRFQRIEEGLGLPEWIQKKRRMSDE